MKFREIIALEKSFSHPLELKDAFGDAVLLNTCPYYLNIRKCAVKLKYHFSPDKFQEYHVQKIFYLKKILRTKTIPYVSNRASFEEIDSFVDNTFDWNQIPLPLSNQTFHESCHCVAADILSLPTSLLSYNHRPLQQQQEVVLDYILAEAFANAVETISMYFTSSKISRHAQQMNNYMIDQISPVLISALLATQIPSRILLRALLFYFLFCNYGYLYPGADFIESSWKIICTEPIDEQQQAVLKQHGRNIKLNTRFLLKSNPLFFRSLGLRTPYSQLLNYDFMGSIESSRRVQLAIERLIASAIEEESQQTNAFTI